jgi:hypothetical protein
MVSHIEFVKKEQIVHPGLFELINISGLRQGSRCSNVTEIYTPVYAIKRGDSGEGTCKEKGGVKEVFLPG